MKKTKKITSILLAVCLFAAGILGLAQSTDAAAINNLTQAKAKALAKVPNATVTEAKRDHENGVLVYDIELVKGNKKYDITYRASDAKMLEYEWETISVSPSSHKALITESKCKSLANSKVKNGTILSIVQKRDDGIDIYKVKMSGGDKAYTLKYHARTGALIDYKWKLTASASNSTGSSNSSGSSSPSNTENGISLEKAKQIALAKVPGGTVTKAEYDVDDGIPVYEIEIKKGGYEYEYKIHAQTGKILEWEKELDD